MAEAATIPAKATRRRTWRGWLVRLAVGSVLLICTAYVTLPYWLPVSWLVQRLSRQWSQGLQRQVTIGRMSVSWAQGISIEDLAVAHGDDDDQHPYLLKVGRIRCGFTPLRTLWTGQVDRLEIIEPQFWFVITREGAIDWASNDSAGEFRTPALEYRVERAVCHVVTPEVSQSFQIDEVTCRLLPDTATLLLTSIASPSRPPGTAAAAGRLSVDVQLTVPQLNRSLDLELGGKGQVHWSGLALSDLPVPIAARLPVEQVAGTTSGHFTFNARSDLGVDYDLGFTMQGVCLAGGGLGRSRRIPDAVCRLNGQWNSVSDVFSLDDLRYESGAVLITAPGQRKGPVLLVDPRGGRPLSLDLDVFVKDWSRLIDEFPEVDQGFEDTGTELTGSGFWHLELTRLPDSDLLVADFSGTETALQSRNEHEAVLLTLPAGRTKSLRVRVEHRHGQEGLWSLDAGGSVGDAHLTLKASLPSAVLATSTGGQGTPDARRLLDLQSAEVVLAATIEELQLLAPRLMESLQFRQGRGLTTLQASFARDSKDVIVSSSVYMEPDTSVELGTWLRKSAGRALSARVGGRFPTGPGGTIGNWICRMSYGPSSIEIGLPGAEIRYTQDGLTVSEVEGLTWPHHWAFSWKGSVAAKAIEGFSALLPTWEQLWQGLELRQLAGDITAALEGEASSAEDRWSVRHHVELTMDQAAIYWRDWLAKPMGADFRLDVDQKIQPGRDGSHHQVRVQARRSAGSITCSAAWRGHRLPAQSLEMEDFSLAADLRDVRGWSAILPPLDAWIREQNLDGELRTSLLTRFDGEQVGMTFSVDALGAEFTLPEPWPLQIKPRGVAAGFSLQSRADQLARGTLDAAGGDGPWAMLMGRRWAISELKLNLAGFRVDEALGHWTLGYRRAADGEAIPGLHLAELKLRGGWVVDESLPHLAERWRQPCEKLDLSGGLDWESELSVHDGAAILRGRVWADEARFACRLEQGPIPMLRKQTGVPVLLTFDTALERNEPLAGVTAKLKQLSLAIAGNEVHLSGKLDLDAKSSLAGATFTAELDLKEPQRLLHLVPESQIKDLGGRWRMSATVSGTAGAFLVDRGFCQFESFTVGLGSDTLHLDGQVVFEEPTLEVDQLHCQWGVNSASLSGLIRRGRDSYVGRVGVAVEQFDMPAWQANLQALSRPAEDPAKPSGQTWDVRDLLVEVCRRSNVDVHIQVGTARLVLPPSVLVDASAVEFQAAIDQGPSTLIFKGLVDGGQVTGSVDMRADQVEPMIHLKYKADQLQPGPVVRAYLARTFPGTQATGPLTMIDESFQKLRAPADEYEIGSGEFIIEGGSIQGRAVPQWMATIFPGLNMSRFEFYYMHSWFHKEASGRVSHQMIFQGQFYNVYMVGYGDKDGRFKYEVGIDFLADFDSKYWADSGQGRVPLFTKTGRVAPDGSIQDEEIIYTPQKLVETILIRNNPLIMAYHAVRHRVLGRRPGGS